MSRHRQESSDRHPSRERLACRNISNERDTQTKPCNQWSLRPSYSHSLDVRALGTKTPGTPTPSRRRSHIHIAAIDNSLSFPHEHPRVWRSFTYGWLFFPVSIIGQPFSEGTRNHFSSLLTSGCWWEETSWQLRQLFAPDPDFHPKVFNVCLRSDKEALVTEGGAFRNN